MNTTIWSNRGGVFHTLRPGETMQGVHARCQALRSYTPCSFPLWVADDEEAEEIEALKLVDDGTEDGQLVPIRVFVGALKPRQEPASEEPDTKTL